MDTQVVTETEGDQRGTKSPFASLWPAPAALPARN